MDHFRRGYVVLAALITLIAVIRVVSSYSHTAQTFDEPTHIGAALELLEKGTYTLDPVHPPLARIAIGLPLRLAGERYPNLSSPDSNNSNTVGDAILNDSGHYMRNLMLARLGVLPFLLLGCGVVFFWARREYGDFAGLAAIGLFTTLPIVLALSSIAYTDMVAASTQAAAFWVFSIWLDKRNVRSTAWMGIAAGLALMAKATTCIYLPAAALSMVGLKWAVRRREASPKLAFKETAKQLLVAGAIAAAVVWAGYGFAVGHVRESMGLSAESMPSFQHFPAPLGKIGRDLILSDPQVPAPALIRGLATAWVLNKTHPPAYLLGHIKSGGWWYFFLVGVAVKAPLPFLILVAVGLFSFGESIREGRWTAMAPAACALAILLVTMPVKYNAGVRHVLVVFPLLAIVGGRGCSYLWNWNWQGSRVWGRSALIALLVWQSVSTVRASGDYIAYFNELAGKDPSRVLVAGCDLDCGQDLFALSRELHKRNVSHANIAIWTSTDMSKTDLPQFEIPQPYQPVTGWFAISLRALRFGDLFHSSYPPDAFAWLNRYQPVARVGKTILLYYIPKEATESESK